MSDILFLAHRVPFPPDRGDKIRSYHVLRHLAARARVHLVAFADELADRDPPPEFRAMLASCTILPRRKARGRAAIEALVSRRPASLAAFADKAMAAAVADVLANHDIARIYAFSGQMAQYLPMARMPVVMDFVDVDSAKFAGFAARARGTMRWLMAREARLLGAYERAVSQRVAASLFVSEAEAALFRSGGAVGTVKVVENGIDTAHFDPDGRFDRMSEDRPLIVFTGQMDYAPNIEAVTGFARDVMPLVRRRHPQALFAVVGRAPTAAVRALAGEDVIVTGTVPDTRGWLAAADLCVAPLALARGIQNKVLEAMAMARPVIASSAAAQGIDHAGTIRIADDPADLADSVCAVLDDPWAAATLGQAARHQVIARYAWDARLAPLDALMGFQ
ncbi:MULTISPECIES: TIGR03087 family PEP-CTERM/XrtA system glycosyltransferase [unclassified Sphingomonas]|uniref:TIGR03087 family PEP-CTERM/XrtA system glycosyltransferase n=1 Tax=unclassified Sphingomonas TaxID=196159 RepID=UPI0022698C71